MLIYLLAIDLLDSLGMIHATVNERHSFYPALGCPTGQVSPAFPTRTGHIQESASGKYQETNLFPAKQSGLHPADIGAIEGTGRFWFAFSRITLVGQMDVLEGEKLGTKGKFGLGGFCNSPSKTDKERKTGFPATHCWYPQSGTLWTWRQEKLRSFLLILVVL